MQAYRGNAIHFDQHLQMLVGSDGRMIPLRPQSSDVLRLLVANQGQVISKQEIVNAVWSGQAVSDDSVYQCISEIRRAIGPGGGLKVRTVSRRGYLVEKQSAPASAIAARDFTIADAEPIRNARSRDGTRLAWTASGRGLPVLKAPSWINHLGLERRNRLYGPFYSALGRAARIVRYDQRGTGMSSWHIPPLTMERMHEDILAVAEAAGFERFFLLGLSQGVAYAVSFAAHYPDRVLGIVGRGGYALGDLADGNEQNRLIYEGSVRMAELGWDSDDPTFRRHFTSRLVPGATPEMAHDVEETQRAAIPKENLRALLYFNATIDVRDDVAHVACPVLLIHARDDRLMPFASGQFLADRLPSCQLIAVDGENHVAVPGTEDFDMTVAAIDTFLQEHAPKLG